MLFRGQCHCGAIRVELTTDRQPSDQVLGACQCSFCRKHNARAFSDPKAHVTLMAADPLDDRALFTRTPEARDYSAENREGRIARRKARWCPTTLVGWPVSPSG